jgi:hypothetical protein
MFADVYFSSLGVYSDLANSKPVERQGRKDCRALE